MELSDIRVLGNITLVKIDSHNLHTRSGIFIPTTTYKPRGACVSATVVGIGDSEEPVKADYKVGDKIVFQKNAAISTLLDADMAVRNIDIIAKLEEGGRVTPLGNRVLCEHSDINMETESGIRLIEDTFNTMARIISVGPDVKELVPGDIIVLDEFTGSFLITDDSYCIADTVSGIMKDCMIYEEGSILAKRVEDDNNN